MLDNSSNLKVGEYGNIYVMIKGKSVYIANPQKIKINKLIYSTNSCTLYEDEKNQLKRVISSTPIYEILNIPSKSYFKIEDVDPFEDGLGSGTNISYYADEIHWDNGEIEKEGWVLEQKSINEKTFFRESEIPADLVEISVDCKKIGEEEGYIK